MPWQRISLQNSPLAGLFIKLTERANPMTKCPHCGIEFNFKSNKKYCSDRCGRKASEKRRKARKPKKAYAPKTYEPRECKECSKEIKARANKKYCSKKCSNKVNDRIKRSKVTNPTCNYCNKVFEWQPYVKYCSPECKKEMYKSASLARTKTSQCKNCNKHFMANIRSIKKYCSFACTLESKYAGMPPVSERSRKAQRNFRERNAPGLSQYEMKVLRLKWKNDNRLCEYCQQDFDTIDHIIPLIRGGNNLENNLAPCCRKCNSSKGSKLLSEWKPEVYA